jgi:hypothetical protein
LIFFVHIVTGPTFHYNRPRLIYCFGFRKLKSASGISGAVRWVRIIATIAMSSGLTIDQLRQMPLIQPSASEALMAVLRQVR